MIPVVNIKSLPGVVESVDTRDLKSLAGNSVPVQVWRGTKTESPDLSGLFALSHLKARTPQCVTSLSFLIILG